MPKRAVVVGAGIAGTTTAYYLSEAGYDVTVVEAKSEVAFGSSHANAGIISPALAGPHIGPMVVVAELGRALRGIRQRVLERAFSRMAGQEPRVMTMSRQPDQHDVAADPLGHPAAAVPRVLDVCPTPVANAVGTTSSFVSARDFPAQEDVPHRLSMKVEWSTNIVRWGARMLLASVWPGHHEQTTRVLASLSRATAQEITRTVDQHNLDLPVSKGFYIFSTSEEHWLSEQQEVKERSHILGSAHQNLVQLLNPAEVAQQQPFVKHSALHNKVVGAVLGTTDLVVDSQAYTNGIYSVCMDRGVNFMFCTAATGLVTRYSSGKGQVVAVRVRTRKPSVDSIPLVNTGASAMLPSAAGTSNIVDGEVPADIVVLCNASASNTLLRESGIHARLPIANMKGHSLTVPIGSEEQCLCAPRPTPLCRLPQGSVLLGDDLVVISNMSDRLRVASGFSLTDRLDIDLEAVAILHKHLGLMVPGVRRPCHYHKGAISGGLPHATPSPVKAEEPPVPSEDMTAVAVDSCSVSGYKPRPFPKRPEGNGQHSTHKCTLGTAWCGFRPLSPDNRPITGVLPGYTNLYVNTGHGMWGLSTGAATGKLVAHLVSGGQKWPGLAQNLHSDSLAPQRFPGMYTLTRLQAAWRSLTGV